MKSFKDMGIEAESTALVGEKIKIKKVFGEEIEVHAYKIAKSKYENGDGQCLHMQIKLKGEMHVVFTGSVYLRNEIEKVNKNDFPFTTIIIEENEIYKFS